MVPASSMTRASVSVARRFTSSGWSIKKLVREIVLSRTYRMSSRPHPQGRAQDPLNVSLYRMRIRRLPD